METFPTPKKDEEKSGVLNTVKKVVLGVAALGAVSAAEAQSDTHIPESASYSTYESSSTQMENAKMVQNLTALENEIKSFSRNASSNHEHTYSFLAESEVLGQVSYIPNAIENIAVMETEVSFVKSAETFSVMSRDFASIKSLVRERDFEDANSESKQKVMDTYVPVDTYVVVGVTKDSSDHAQIRIRLVDMHTKAVSYKVVSLELKSGDDSGQSREISNAVNEYLKTIVK